MKDCLTAHADRIVHACRCVCLSSTPGLNVCPSWTRTPLKETSVGRPDGAEMVNCPIHFRFLCGVVKNELLEVPYYAPHFQQVKNKYRLGAIVTFVTQVAR
jgi:hypothetical protein